MPLTLKSNLTLRLDLLELMMYNKYSDEDVVAALVYEG